MWTKEMIRFADMSFVNKFLQEHKETEIYGFAIMGSYFYILVGYTKSD